MSPAVLAWSAVWTLVAAVACVRLLRASIRPEPYVRNGYRWLAVGTACLAVGGILQQALGGLIGGAQPLRMADLVSLAALPALVIGLGTLTSDVAGGEPAAVAGAAKHGAANHGAANHGAANQGGRLLREPAEAAQAGPPAGIAVDSCLLVCALFAILLVALFGPDYATADAGRAAFALALIRPAADLAAFGLVLRFAVRSPRRTLLALVALVAVAVADSFAVGDRIAGGVPGLGARIFLTGALIILALAPAPAFSLAGLVGSGALGQGGGTPAPVPDQARSGASWSSPATIAALGATAAAAVVVTGFSLGGGRIAVPALAITCAAIVLLLVARLAGLIRHASAAEASAHESDWMFRALARSTSDAVLICDLVGTIEYASQAVADFGYEPGEITGRRLAELVHPEDRPAGIRAAITGLRAASGTATFAGRVRGADGSWRHVESTLSRYGQAGAPVRLLITTRDVSDRVALRRQVTHLTFHDGLTGLPNRAYAEERVKDLSQALAGETPSDIGPLVAAILVDLDGYSAINNLIGSTSADLLLAQAARRLRAAVPPPAIVARWGSDEFAILVTDAAGESDILDLAQRLAGQIAAEPFAVAGKEITMTASVGVSVTSPEVADQVLAHASIALSMAKENGAGRVEVFAAEMRAQATRRAELAAELAHAISDDQLQIDYLPVIELATGQVREVEAKVRWDRPDGETIRSAELLGIAGSSGLVGGLSDWLLAQACQHVAAWRAGGWDVGLSVRCAARHVSGPRFARSVIAALDQADLPAQALTLEIDEQVLLDGAAPAAADLAGLRAKGVRLALGSYGTGYASLAQLRRSAVDAIKIDASFVAGLETDPTLVLLTSTIIQLAHDLGIDVVAEGIERTSQRDQLLSMSCGLGQGPGIAGPMAASDAEPTLAGQAGTLPEVLPADR